MAKIAMPDDVQPGPLYEYLMWLRELHEAAGSPAARPMARALSVGSGSVSHQTINRYFKQAPINRQLVYQLVCHLVQNNLRRPGNENDVDDAYDRLEELLNALAHKEPVGESGLQGKEPRADDDAKAASAISADLPERSHTEAPESPVVPNPAPKKKRRSKKRASPSDSGKTSTKPRRVQAPTSPGGLNRDASWDAFDPAAYMERRFEGFHPQDAEILSIIGEYFSHQKYHAYSDRVIHGIDVGAGPNLYPALSMLPWCSEITLINPLAQNIDYLSAQLSYFDSQWGAHWDILCKNQPYAAIDPRERLAQVAQIEHGSLVDLGRHKGRWMMGTMLFAADVLATTAEEFQLGVNRFMRSLAPGSPFAMAFMRDIEGRKKRKRTLGYIPTESDVHATISPLSRDFAICTISSGTLETGAFLAYGERAGFERFPV
ncbi:hypothetical protein ACWDCB_40365 [Streptomyces sp. NPDC001178]